MHNRPINEANNTALVPAPNSQLYQNAHHKIYHKTLRKKLFCTAEPVFSTWLYQNPHHKTPSKTDPTGGPSFNMIALLCNPQHTIRDRKQLPET